MIYVIMCGGYYEMFKTPKQFTEVNGERLVDRTIRLLRENGVTDIYVSATDERFDSCGVPRLVHNNSFRVENGIVCGYWLDAFYLDFPVGTKVTYLFGDVCFTEQAIRKIVNYKTDKNVLFGSGIARNKQHKNWGEPFAYLVSDYATFVDGVKTVKQMWDNGEVYRNPLVWELYRYLNGLDINVQRVLDTTFVAIDDGTIDIDGPEQITRLKP